MVYTVKEMFYTLQGEGAQAGRPAVFCRFAGCNLWTGLERDRAKAICQFCDTDFVGTDGEGGGKFKTAADLASAVKSLWLGKSGKPLVVCTGGEPLLQLDGAAVEAFHDAGFEIAVESNGTVEPPEGIDWLCISPKIGSEMIVKGGQELKLVYPQEGGDPAQFEGLDFEHFFLQPMDCDVQAENTAKAVDYCKAHPQWRLSLQTHKFIDIP
ncbi:MULTISPECIES: 7-carboxy-7-deazaguanine synthase [Kordiimonas]|jgi:7-carboxy-7-deazaguanine synthase (Cx14CxxC type)|uniref:7-carboxy-7-deazaguanine synthase n=1 Tax=Kordiimonas lacus TaxID=637679 RepID=A0A1G6VPK1_9PROT|nr:MULTISPECIES: 7-carboxy-7-deazaguanine synthase [Kordiimonas]SDD54785.1 7-carboxy-7-deazaguanine synthase, Cx14CxxC type [Kordiimonas lacus]